MNMVKIILPQLRNIIVSYQQVYNWVKKYLSRGENGLKDNCGKKIENRDKAELTDAEKAELKLKEAEDRIRRLEVENFMLKNCTNFKGGR
ncbi:hypothetical protein [Ligilactobacillus salivarius]|uniref:hypothetical protein n=1 Tax=Ligilactobacillus salivarius TaxID=1624 RepID=UPI0024B9C064|nr:hypothetical protein [Ligilactobacillus salivarius]